jgi:CheY-like chemotaxis protein/signal transduction histidine kinase/CHASE3 domain sensor protein
MTDERKAGPAGRRSGVELYFGITVVLCVFVASGVISYLNTRTLTLDAQQITHSHNVLTALDDVLSLAKDAETGQRGYLITGDETYLEPHTAAVARINERLNDIERLTRDNAAQQDRIPSLRARINAKLSELEETIKLRRTKGFEAALAIVVTDRGKGAMDAIRARADEMRKEELVLRSQRLAEMENAYQTAVGMGMLSGAIGIFLVCAFAYLVRRSLITRERLDWIQAGQIGLSKVMLGEQRVDQLGESVLKFLAEYVDAHAGALFVRDGVYRRVATYGVPAAGGAPDSFEQGDGLLGQAAKDGRTFYIRDVPDGYLSVGSGLGRGKPRHLVVVPMKEDGAVNGVLELGLMHPIDETHSELFENLAESIGIAVRSANYRAHVQNLLHETQRQAEELQSQGEELRVSNEELEEQGRALRESQSRLEMQQTELEQINAQLEEQATILEAQRDDASRAKAALQVQARELEQASRYKSDFLANMSHELRTPLNSSLILAKLLADNREGNLTDEQVQYAETIRTAGNDLLALINDILDLSKIEAGHMEVSPEPVKLAALVDELGRIVRPVAEQKKLDFQCRVGSDCPETIDTDRRRLEQILKNLLSNAIKFTEAGEVTLDVSSAAGDTVAFAVRDTGIGIPERQQAAVFEAFRQADGTTNRKYGGTGLGLSIARELTRILGGELHLASGAGRGSTFTLTLPKAFNSALLEARPQSPSTAREDAGAPRLARGTTALLEEVRGGHGLQIEPSGGAAARYNRIADDREQLTGSQRVILVVEDDPAFARIIYDLAHENGFRCLIATTAEEALAMASQYRPSAVVLDVGLPDQSGLSVLDRLKHDSRTRHIPVHVVSAHDYSRTALALGAVGYMIKPVKREELGHALAQLEARLEQRLRRVLIVEDDPVQLASLRKLLEVQQVETVGAQSAGKCLELLKETTFDCMVLDLSLPDASGYSLLETLSREDTYSFPPVIVYTGRELSLDEEQQLRRYSKSIIIKGAKSPERLLDEVTLFLHQVVSELPADKQRMLARARSRDSAIEGRRVLVVEDDVRNVFALTSILEARGAKVQIARNGREALAALEQSRGDPGEAIDLVLMDIMMPEMDGITAIREIRKDGNWRKLPIIALTAKAMKNDQEECVSAGANDYLAKPLDVEKLLSLVRVWMPR